MPFLSYYDVPWRIVKLESYDLVNKNRKQSVVKDLEHVLKTESVRSKLAWQMYQTSMAGHKSKEQKVGSIQTQIKTKIWINLDKQYRIDTTLQRIKLKM